MWGAGVCVWGGGGRGVCGVQVCVGGGECRCVGAYVLAFSSAQLVEHLQLSVGSNHIFSHHISFVIGHLHL